ncbi:MAG TPA: Rrf2 family transcriptional regulator [Terriglobia bacterium]|nr:Rrf2 family transcriptional regulator [Terriglobia bacterium]
MRISKKGLYALEALMMLARNYPKRAAKIREIAAAEEIPEKFLELILLDLKRARLVESLRGVNGGYVLRRDPSKIVLGEVIRTIDGPLAPLGDVDTLRALVKLDKKHTSLYRVFLEVRDATAQILDHTSLADLCSPEGRRQKSEVRSQNEERNNRE